MLEFFVAHEHERVILMIKNLQSFYSVLITHLYNYFGIGMYIQADKLAREVYFLWGLRVSR